ncbi:TPA: hypothetical protein SCR98_000309 [Enterobacter kobei]|uniref:hypothetical protein n=1 Tax=Enterobacter kobei TaxID=208224 RepID=UPI002987906C|nr:hypothetical protein [Enterobacter kobei]
MKDYALIRNGVVENVVRWDGNGDLFIEYITYEIKEEHQVGPGFSANKNSGGEWVFEAPVIVITPEEHAVINLQSARSEYDRASAKITALYERIEDEDYTGTTEAVVKNALATWTTYRKYLRSYISADDGSLDLPLSPDA